MLLSLKKEYTDWDLEVACNVRASCGVRHFRPEHIMYIKFGIYHSFKPNLQFYTYIKKYKKKKKNQN